MIDAHLPPPGTPTQPVEAGYMANAYVRMRHPDYDVLRGMLDDVGRSRARARRMSERRGARGMTITVLGPQRRPTVTPLPPGTVAATITAGWRAREPDDAELDRLLGGGTVNLRLYERWLDVLDQDRELAAAEVNHRAVAEELQELYALQVERANQAMDAIRRTAHPAADPGRRALRRRGGAAAARRAAPRRGCPPSAPTSRRPGARPSGTRSPATAPRSGPSWTGPAYW